MYRTPRVSDRRLACLLFGLLAWTLTLCLLKLEPRRAPVVDDFQARSACLLELRDELSGSPQGSCPPEVVPRAVAFLVYVTYYDSASLMLAREFFENVSWARFVKAEPSPFFENWVLINEVKASVYVSPNSVSLLLISRCAWLNGSTLILWVSCRPRLR
jgi:hypothetical protein